MFRKLFGKKDSQKSVAKTAKKDSYELLGPVEGSLLTIEYIRRDIGKVLFKYPDIHNAWLSKIKYNDEDFVRIALLVEPSERVPPKTWHAITSEISEFMALDVFPKIVSDKVKADCHSLFDEGENLFKIPILVSRGSNKEMPESWKQGILNFFVADNDMERAMERALNVTVDEGYEYQSIFQDSVFKIEADSWWDKYVMDRWPEYGDSFMTQDEIPAFMKVGGLHLGPRLEWDEDQPLGSTFG